MIAITLSIMLMLIGQSSAFLLFKPFSIPSFSALSVRTSSCYSMPHPAPRRVLKHPALLALRAGLETRNNHKDKQWDLFVKNYRGDWVGNTTWYDRSQLSKTIDFKSPAEVIESRYNISFSDDGESGIWEGSGLRHSNGTRTLPLSRATYNAQGSVWQFPGAGGLGSTSMDTGGEVGAKRMHEAYFFHDGVGAMILVIYTKSLDENQAGRLVLQSVGTMPFVQHTGRGSAAPQTHQQSPTLDAAKALHAVEGWRGARASFGPRSELTGSPGPCGPFDPRAFAAAPVSVALDGGLVLAVPETIDAAAGPFELRFGCRLSPATFAQVAVSFSAGGALQAWTHDVYSAPRP
jgi:hypothetical protein